MFMFVFVQVKTHGWKHCKAPTSMLGCSAVYVIPGRRLPTDGGVHGKDYFKHYSEVADFLQRGYGLRPYAGAPTSQIPLPDEVGG